MKHKDRTKVPVVSVTRDGTKIIGGDGKRSIKVWDAKLHELVQEWIHNEGCHTVIAISPDDQLIATTDGSDVGVYTVQGRLVNIVVNRETIWSMAQWKETRMWHW